MSALTRLLRPVSRLHVVTTRITSLRPPVTAISVGVRGIAAKAPAKSKSRTTAAAAKPKKKATTSAAKKKATTSAAKKKTAAKKPAAKKKAAAKKPAAKKRNTAKAAKKPAVKRTMVTPERRMEIRETEKRRAMKADALKPPCRPSPRMSAFNVYVSETMATPGKAALITKETAENFHKLPDADKAVCFFHPQIPPPAVGASNIGNTEIHAARQGQD